jgi:predicted phosphodiesterase
MVRIGVCSDVHGRHDRLLAVLGAMASAGVDERWCLGDLVGPSRLRRSSSVRFVNSTC